MEGPWEWKYTHKLEFHWLFPFTAWLSITTTIAIFKIAYCHAVFAVCSVCIFFCMFSSENVLLLACVHLFIWNSIEVFKNNCDHMYGAHVLTARPWLKQTSLCLLTVVQTNPLSSPMLPLRTALELLRRNRALSNLHMTFEYSDNCRIHALRRCMEGLRQNNSGVKTDWMESGPFGGFGVVDSLVWKSPLVKLVILWVVTENERSRWISEF